MTRRERTTAIALLISVLVIGALILVVLSAGGDEEEGTAGGQGSTVTQTETNSRTETETQTTSANPDGEEAQVSETVIDYIDAAANEDGDTLCKLQSAGGQTDLSGRQALEACAAVVGFDLAKVPGLQDASVQDVEVKDKTATARFGAGEFSLEKVDGRWKIDGFRAGGGGARPGGHEAPPAP